MAARNWEGRRHGGIGRLFRLSFGLLVAAILLTTIVGWSRAAIACEVLGGGDPTKHEAPATGPGARPEAQTYLTLPEWYVVFSADEYAAFLGKDRPSGFPYFRAVGQFWQAYYEVCTVAGDRYPFNSDYQLMLAVVGTSFTAENIVKGVYENTVGRLSEWSSSGTPTPEEEFGRQVAAEYGAFIHVMPWYEFPFWSKIGPLWATTPAEPDTIRKVERRVALTTEYVIKAGYGWAIRQGAATVFTPEDLEIRTRAEGVTPEIAASVEGVRIADDGAVILPRYEAFTRVMPRLVERGVSFTEIAGNDEIMLTVLAPGDWRPSGGNAEILFRMPILTEPERTRVAIRVPVRSLHTVLGEVAGGNGAALEHIFDY